MLAVFCWLQTQRICATPCTFLITNFRDPSRADTDDPSNSGGLGLTGGIVDVDGLYQCLSGIYHNKADEKILDIYDEVRRQKYNEIINPISSENLLRMFSVHPDKVLESDRFLKLCKEAESDQEKVKEIMKVS